MISNNTKKFIKSLQRKKNRKEHGLFTVEGRKITEEIIKECPETIKAVYVTQKFLEKNSEFPIPAEVISEKDMHYISQMKTPPGVLALVKILNISFSFNDLRNKITLALDGIKDPGNLGTIIRIADWYGVEHVLCSEDCVDLYNPKVLQATMGSFLRVKVLYTDLPETLADLKEKIGAHVTGTVLNGIPIQEFLQKNSCKTNVFVIGNEAFGISKEVSALQDYGITLPKKGRAESLNAAVFTAVLLDKITCF